MKTKTFQYIKTYFMITLGLLIYTFGWTAFLIPAGIVGGGVTGISSLIFFSTGLPVGIINLIINGILVLIAMKILGAKFGINTVFGILMSSFFFILLQHYIKQPLVDDPFMCALIGAMLSGLGVGIAFSNGGNSGGTDIVALLVTNYYNISPGRVIIYIDIAIIASSYLVFQSVEKIVFGYVVMGVFGYTLDMVIEGNKQSYQFMVFSNNNNEIADRIGNEIQRGVTLLKGMGWYTKHDQNVLLVIAQKQDKQAIMKIIKECDDSAFISIAKVSGVFGKNFDRIKI
ncbi:MAG: YitT family protein [Bacteroidota bacterium]|jgi:uncharacterized membrane-anchored protein YitT (DUF2179 family)